MEAFGWISLLPTLLVLVLALWTRRTFTALLGGVLLGCLILAKGKFFQLFTEQLSSVMGDPVIVWIILVCGLFGSLIHLLVASGGALAFADKVLQYVHNRSSALLMTWGLGLSIFIDDYLNALTVGSSMKKVTDRFGVSREMLAYIVDSTAAPICVLIPLSTWAIYISGLLEEEGVAAAGQGLATYVGIIPYIFYGWAAALIVPLVAKGWIPPLGPMKAAEARAASGQLIPPGSESIRLEMPEVVATDKPPSSWYFILPILVLIAATIWFDVDALKGVMVAVVFTVIYYLSRGLMKLEAAMENVFSGFKTMLYALGIIVMSFVLKEVNDGLGLTEYIIEGVSPWLDGRLLPMVCFLSLSVITFATGSFWGVYAITLPIILPLAAEVDVSQPLALGAVISAGAFGSHACFYGDATVLSASATGCNNMAHVLTQLPYTLLAAGLAALAYLLFGILA